VRVDNERNNDSTNTTTNTTTTGGEDFRERKVGQGIYVEEEGTVFWVNGEKDGIVCCVVEGERKVHRQRVLMGREGRDRCFRLW